MRAAEGRSNPRRRPPAMVEPEREAPGIIAKVSADATSGQIERLTSLGAQAYLTKPLNVKHFVRVIEDLLGEKEH